MSAFKFNADIFGAHATSAPDPNRTLNQTSLSLKPPRLPRCSPLNWSAPLALGGNQPCPKVTHIRIPFVPGPPFVQAL